jgi:hypothetical protein
MIGYKKDKLMNETAVLITIKVLKSILKHSIENVDIDKLLDKIKDKLEDLLKIDFDETEIDEKIEQIIKENIKIDTKKVLKKSNFITLKQNNIEKNININDIIELTKIDNTYFIIFNSVKLDKKGLKRMIANISLEPEQYIEIKEYLL